MVIGCGQNKYLKEFPENDLLEAALDAQRYDFENELKLQICGAYGMANMGNQLDASLFMQELERTYRYKEKRDKEFLRGIRSYLKEYENNLSENPELLDKIPESKFNLVTYPARLSAAKYFGVDNSEVKEALKESNIVSYFDRYNPNTQIIVKALQEKEKSIEKPCRDYFDEILEDKVQPNFSDFGNEYKKITGIGSLKN
ncbi:hypothetical protein [Acinetobacter sp. YH12099]|nr:hypothetical protein [Acinetobacter sp. YH12099]